MTIKQLLVCWNKYWFTPDSPAPVCLFRIFYGILVLACALLWMPDLLTFFGSRGVVSIPTIQQYEQTARFSLLFFLPFNDLSVVLVQILLIVAAIFMTIGLYTRVSTIIVVLTLISFHHRNPLILNSGDALLRVVGLILIFAPIDRMFSVDYFRKTRSAQKPDGQWNIRCNVWAQHLIQWQIAAVYCQTFWCKLLGETWRNGTAVYYTSRLEEFFRLPVPFVFDHLWTCKLLTWGALGIELSLWTLIWIKEFRYYVLLAGIILHASIDWSMNIPIFEYTMIALYINFVDAKDLKRVLNFLKTFIENYILHRGQRLEKTPLQ